MHGPRIMARTIQATNVKGWQYHSRSDAHSKAACWAVLFDLLRYSQLLRTHAATGVVGFGINHQMRDYKQNRKKDLDLVICLPGAGGFDPVDFRQLGERYGIVLSDEERKLLDALPPLRQAVVGNVHVALEAKACMTEHVKARPRLYDELSSSHQTIHGDTESAIAVGFVTVNVADRFASPTNQNRDVRPGHADLHYNVHKQPDYARAVLEKVEQIHRSSKLGETGFEAIGVVLLDAANDGGPIDIVEKHVSGFAVPEILRYEQMILRTVKWYGTRFGSF